MDKSAGATWADAFIAAPIQPMTVVDLARRWRALDAEYDRVWNEALKKYGAANMLLPQVTERLIPLMNERDAALMRLRKAIDSLEAIQGQNE